MPVKLSGHARLKTALILRDALPADLPVVRVRMTTLKEGAAARLKAEPATQS